MKQIVINIDENTKNAELAMTAEGMVSADYKERFIAEYIQIKNRYNGLKKMLSLWDECYFGHVAEKEMDSIPSPKCDREVYVNQLRAMNDYMDILVVRAKIEGIEL